MFKFIDYVIFTLKFYFYKHRMLKYDTPHSHVIIVHEDKPPVFLPVFKNNKLMNLWFDKFYPGIAILPIPPKYGYPCLVAFCINDAVKLAFSSLPTGMRAIFMTALGKIHYSDDLGGKRYVLDTEFGIEEDLFAMTQMHEEDLLTMLYEKGKIIHNYKLGEDKMNAVIERIHNIKEVTKSQQIQKSDYDVLQ